MVAVDCVSKATVITVIASRPCKQTKGCEDALHKSYHAVFSIFTSFGQNQKPYLSIIALDCDHFVAPSAIFDRRVFFTRQRLVHICGDGV